MIDRGFAPGVSVAIVWEGNAPFTLQFGRSSLEGEQPVTADTRFRLGSISKFVTAAIIMKLAEEGLLDLRAPVASMFQDDAVFGRLPGTVTVEHLLSHTSGLPDFTREELEAKVARSHSTDADLYAVLDRPPLAPPGQHWAYADGPYRILSRLVERASGIPFGDYVADRFAPALGLSSLRMCEPGAPDHARGYLSDKARFRPEAAYSIRGLLGEGGMCATAADLARLPVALVGSGWLTGRSLGRMIAPTILNDGTVIDYGFGTRGGLLGRHRAWGHTGGGLHGSWAAVAYYPEQRVSVAVAANGTGGDVDAAVLQGQIAALALGVEPPAATVPDERLIQTLVGTYVRGERVTCLFSSAGKLMRVREGQPGPPTPLFQQDQTTFARLDYPLDRLVFQFESNETVAYLVYFDGLFSEHWRRAPGRACTGASAIADR